MWSVFSFNVFGSHRALKKQNKKKNKQNWDLGAGGGDMTLSSAPCDVGLPATSVQLFNRPKFPSSLTRGVKLETNMNYGKLWYFIFHICILQHFPFLQCIHTTFNTSQVTEIAWWAVVHSSAARQQTIQQIQMAKQVNINYSMFNTQCTHYILTGFASGLLK